MRGVRLVALAEEIDRTLDATSKHPRFPVDAGVDDGAVMTTPPNVLIVALSKRIDVYERAFNLIEREVDLDDADVAKAVRAMQEAVELTRCLRRLVEGRLVEEIHHAFGAPGDFGYETVIGDALARLYGVR